MFKNKYLKQLQNIQAQIKNCKTSLLALSPPITPSYDIGSDLYHWLGMLCYAVKPDITLLDSLDFDDSYSDCLHKLGEYFINITNYRNTKLEYDKEIAQLQKEERRLKDKLGIE